MRKVADAYLNVEMLKRTDAENVWLFKVFSCQTARRHVFSYMWYLGSGAK